MGGRRLSERSKKLEACRVKEGGARRYERGDVALGRVGGSVEDDEDLSPSRSLPASLDSVSTRSTDAGLPPTRLLFRPSCSSSARRAAHRAASNLRDDSAARLETSLKAIGRS
jgi:hypothetical protein